MLIFDDDLLFSMKYKTESDTLTFNKAMISDCFECRDASRVILDAKHNNVVK